MFGLMVKPILILKTFKCDKIIQNEGVILYEEDGNIIGIVPISNILYCEVEILEDESNN